ncbi:MAG: NifB/NifX family molybdenum-iron cluster-binding protein [Candidatus Izemoplasmatales bacterium]|jgi:predicted Fe-Mo cluster-binding NifX family protein|nr:NifB/NifX family molybdenum-iron cluster-binding protein [Candidatus Izemoplasmatales bacterium]
MKIAIASTKNMVCEHFGYCEKFTIYEIEQEQITNKTEHANPGHRPGFLPEFLSNLGVNVIIAGAMGSGAVDHFNEKQISTILGVSGDVDSVIKKWLSHDLKSTETVCIEHRHHGDC